MHRHPYSLKGRIGREERSALDFHVAEKEAHLESCRTKDDCRFIVFVEALQFGNLCCRSVNSCLRFRVAYDGDRTYGGPTSKVAYCQ